MNHSNVIRVEANSKDIEYHNDKFNENCIIKSKSGETLKVVWLDNLQDFDFNKYRTKDNAVFKFRNCSHVFTFGNINAKLDTRLNFKFLENLKNPDIINGWTIAFGDGDAINEGLGYAIALEGGKIQSLYRAIAVGNDRIFLTSDLYHENFHDALKKGIGYDVKTHECGYITYANIFNIKFTHCTIKVFIRNEKHVQFSVGNYVNLTKSYDRKLKCVTEDNSKNIAPNEIVLSI